MTIKQLIGETTQRLTPHYGEGEARAMAEMALESIKHWSRLDAVMHSGDDAGEYATSQMGKIIGRLLLDEPLQYILGSANFHGLVLRVTPATLIPRPETSQLVDMIADRAGDRADLRVLDIGTGSGAIAIALARTLKFAQVEAADISREALDVAKLNAKALKVNIDFVEMDIMKDPLPGDTFDIIVSNPPYVTESERPTLSANVALYEPPSALYVPDSDPLVFYRRITSLAAGSLRQGALLAFEINCRFGNEMIALVRSFGFDDATVAKDFRGNDRFLFATKPYDR